MADIGRDLQAVARSEQTAVNDLRDDLQNLSSIDPPPALVDHLAEELGSVLKGTSLPDETAGRLSRQLFVVVAGRELSERQLAALQDDITTTLAEAKVPPSRSRPVNDAAADIQKAVGTNVRRWWQRR